MKNEFGVPFRCLKGIPIYKTLNKHKILSMLILCSSKIDYSLMFLINSTTRTYNDRILYLFKALYIRIPLKYLIGTPN